MNVDSKLRGVKRRLDIPTLSIPSTGAGTASSSTATSSSPSNSSSGTSTSSTPANGYILRKKLNSGRTVTASLGDQKSLLQCKSSSLSSSVPLGPSHSSPTVACNVTSASDKSSHCNSISWQHLSSSEIRQIVFNVSMCKLSRYRQTADPDLFKSVLICTTLKRLQRDLESEGMKINFGSNGVSFVPINGEVTSPSVNEKTVAPSSSTSKVAPVAPLIANEAESSISITESSVECTLTSDCFLLSSKFDSDDSGRLTPHPASEIEPCESSTSSSSSYSSSCSSSSSDIQITSASYSSEQVSLSSRGRCLQDKDETLPVSPVSIESTRQPENHSQQRVDELFGDIDLSMYDFDILAPLKTPSAPKATPITAEDLIESIADEPVPMVDCDSLTTTASPGPSSIMTDASNGNTGESTSSSSSSSASSLSPLSSPTQSPSSSSSSSSSATSTSTSTTSSSSSSVFSKIFLTKKDTIFLEDLSPAIS